MKEATIRQMLETACSERGKAAAIAKHLQIAPSTVKRWLDGGDIPAPMQILLSWYLAGIVPPSMESGVQGQLEFTEDEWADLQSKADAEGVDVETFIAGRIRSYLAWNGTKDQGGE